MTQEAKGTSQTAVLADDLPARARVGLALVAAKLALPLLSHSPNAPLAKRIFELARRWHDGEAIAPNLFVDTLEPEEGVGIALAELNAPSDQERLAWLALACAAYYAAHHAHVQVGYPPSETVCEVDERILDELDRASRTLSPAFMQVMALAAGFLKRRPNASFAEIQMAISPAEHTPR